MRVRVTLQAIVEYTDPIDPDGDFFAADAIEDALAIIRDGGLCDSRVEVIESWPC